MKNYRVRINNREIEASLINQGADFVEFQVDNHSYRVDISPIISMAAPTSAAGSPVSIARPAAQPTAAGSPGEIVAPIPGKVVKVLTEKGKEVSAGDTLLVIEAMKMENNIAAPADGVVAELHVEEGQEVETAQKLVKLDLSG